MKRLALPVLAISALASFGCSASGDDAPAPVSPTDARVDGKTDATADARTDGSVPTDGGADGTTTDGPPPIEDTWGVEDFGLPPTGYRVEGTVGPEGGTLSGASGSVLDGVVLAIPAGALSASTTFALDFLTAPAGPGAAKIVSPYVRVGPEGVAFAKPARLTLPYTVTVSNPQLAPVARIGYSWSSLTDPTGDDKTVTASMRRSSGAALALVDLSTLAPKITASSPSGSTLFLEGTGFGVAQVFRPASDGGAPFVSSVSVGGVVAETLAWSETAISVKLSADAGTVTVTTPGGSASP